MVDIVKEVIPAIEQKSTFFRKVKDGVYVTRCPFCGDSQSNLRKGHLYLLINESGCRCYCHKCNANVPLTNETLTKFIGQHSFNLSGQKIRRIRPSDPTVNVETDVLDRKSQEYQYLKFRLGCDFSPDELHALRVIGNQHAFFDKYGLKQFHPVRDSILFITPDGNTLCYRSISDRNDFRWLKMKVYPKADFCPYVIRGSVDVLSNDEQIIVMAEGIFDVIGVYKNVMKTGNLYVAGMGKDYSRLIRWLINRGVFGKNFKIQIFSDGDVPISAIRNSIRRYRWMYGRIEVIYNDAADDFGVPQDKIMLRDPVIM